MKNFSLLVIISIVQFVTAAGLLSGLADYRRINPLLPKQSLITPFREYIFRTQTLKRLNKLANRPEIRSVHTIKWLNDINRITSSEVIKLQKSILKYGVIKVRNQNISIPQQIEFSKKFGEIIILPKSFQKTYGHPDYPPVFISSNYLLNGTWKGPNQYNIASKWHKDGDFYPFDKGYVHTILYAEEYDERVVNGETIFIDGCKLRKHIPRDIVEHLRNATIKVNVKDILDITVVADDEDMSRQPEVHHKPLFTHPERNEECVFLFYDPKRKMQRRKEDLAILQLWDYMHQPKFMSINHWKKGDLLIFDNFSGFHVDTNPEYIDEQGYKKILHRTWVRSNFE